MKMTDEHLQMLLNPRALKLHSILQILYGLTTSLDDSIVFEREDLVNVFRDIPTLNKYIYLNDIEFAKAMLSLINVSGENVDRELERIFADDCDDYDEIPIGFTEVIAAEDALGDEFNPKIVDFSKCTNYNVYANSHTISYDFIIKMQSTLWNGILDTYLYDYLNNDKLNIYSIQKYDEEYIFSIMLFPNESNVNIYFFRENLVNWAMAHGFIVVDNDVNIIHDEKNHEVIIALDFNL